MFRSSLMPNTQERKPPARKPTGLKTPARKTTPRAGTGVRPRPASSGRGSSSSSTRPGPRPATHGQLFRRLILANWRPPSPEVTSSVDHIARGLDTIPLPDGTELRADQPEGNNIRLWWENTAAQHCVQLDIDLRTMEASYEYSMVCEEHERLKPFPHKPLGSDTDERTLNLRQQRSWSWLGARIKATGRPPRA